MSNTEQLVHFKTLSSTLKSLICVSFSPVQWISLTFFIWWHPGYWSTHILSLKAANVFKHLMILVLMWLYLWIISSQCIIVSATWNNDFLALNESSMLEILNSHLIDSYFTTTNLETSANMNSKLIYKWKNSEINILGNVYF